MINLFRIKTHAHLHTQCLLICIAVVFLNASNHLLISTVCLTEIFIQFAQRKLWVDSRDVPEMHRGCEGRLCRRVRYQSAPMNLGQILAAWSAHAARSLPSLLQPQGSSRFLVRPCHFPPSPWSPEELSQQCCNLFGQLLPERWCYSAPISLWKGYLLKARAFCITVEHDIIFVRPWEELRAQCAFLGGMEERGMLPAHPHLGTTCLCEQKERWLTSCLKRNSPSIINKRVPMEKNIVLISLLDISKAPVIVVSEFRIVYFSLSESSWFFCCFSVHPLPSSHLSCCSVSPIMLHALLHPSLVFLKALLSFIHNRRYFLILISSWFFF